MKFPLEGCPCFGVVADRENLGRPVVLICIFPLGELLGESFLLLSDRLASFRDQTGLQPSLLLMPVAFIGMKLMESALVTYNRSLSDSCACINKGLDLAQMINSPWISTA